MGLLDLLRQTLATLVAQRLRTALTLFGVVWGTASVVFLLAWGRGLETMLDVSFQKIGRNVAFAWPGSIGEQFTPATDRRELWFEQEDVAALRRQARELELVTAESETHAALSYRERMVSLEVHGVEPAAFDLHGVQLAAGRPLTRSDLTQRWRVAVLGQKARERVLGARGGLGAWVRINGTRHQVVGLLQRVGTQLWRGGSELDEQVWVPLTTFQSLRELPPEREAQVDQILVRVAERKRYPQAAAEMRAILSRRLQVSPDDHEAIRVMSPIEMLDRIPSGLLPSVLVAISVTTLLIGGVGILALMLDQIQERQREIGVRLAIGGRRRDILGQFFAETLIVSLLGGGLGLLLGSAAAWSLGLIPAPDLVPVPVLKTDIVWIAIGVLSFTAVASGIVPAWRAARVDPAVTLREE